MSKRTLELAMASKEKEVEALNLKIKRTSDKNAKSELVEKLEIEEYILTIYKKLIRDRGVPMDKLVARVLRETKMVST